MYSVHSEGKSVIAERFMRALKNKIHKYMTSVLKNVYIDKSVNFSKSNWKFCLRLPYNGKNSFLFVNPTKIYQFKTKGSKIKKYPLFRNYFRRFFSQWHKKNHD